MLVFLQLLSSSPSDWISSLVTWKSVALTLSVSCSQCHCWHKIFPFRIFFFFFGNTMWLVSMSIIHWHCAWLSVWCITVSHSTGHANQHNLLSTCAPFLLQRRTGCETWTWWHWHCDIDTPMTMSLHSSSVIDSYFNISTAILLLSYCHSSWTVMVFSYEYDTW